MVIWVLLFYLIPFIRSSPTNHDPRLPKVEITQDDITKNYKIIIKTPYFEKHEEVTDDGIVFGDCKYTFNEELKSISYVISKESFFFLGDIQPKTKFENREQEDGYDNLVKWINQERSLDRTKEGSQVEIAREYIHQVPQGINIHEELPNLNFHQFGSFGEEQNFPYNAHYPQNFQVPYPLQTPTLDNPVYYSGNSDYIQPYGHLQSNIHTVLHNQHSLSEDASLKECLGINCDFLGTWNINKPHLKATIYTRKSQTNDNTDSLNYKITSLIHQMLQDTTKQVDKQTVNETKKTKENVQIHYSANKPPKDTVNPQRADIVEVLPIGNTLQNLEENNTKLNPVKVEQNNVTVSRSKRNVTEKLQPYVKQNESEIGNWAEQYTKDYSTHVETTNSPPEENMLELPNYRISNQGNLSEATEFEIGQSEKQSSMPLKESSFHIQEMLGSKPSQENVIELGHTDNSSSTENVLIINVPDVDSVHINLVPALPDDELKSKPESQQF